MHQTLLAATSNTGATTLKSAIAGQTCGWPKTIARSMDLDDNAARRTDEAVRCRIGYHDGPLECDGIHDTDIATMTIDFADASPDHFRNNVTTSTNSSGVWSYETHASGNGTTRFVFVNVSLNPNVLDLLMES